MPKRSKGKSFTKKNLDKMMLNNMNLNNMKLNKKQLKLAKRSRRQGFCKGYGQTYRQSQNGGFSFMELINRAKAGIGNTYNRLLGKNQTIVNTSSSGLPVESATEEYNQKPVEAPTEPVPENVDTASSNPESVGETQISSGGKANYIPLYLQASANPYGMKINDLKGGLRRSLRRRSRNKKRYLQTHRKYYKKSHKYNKRKSHKSK